MSYKYLHNFLSAEMTLHENDPFRGDGVFTLLTENSAVLPALHLIDVFVAFSRVFHDGSVLYQPSFPSSHARGFLIVFSICLFRAPFSSFFHISRKERTSQERSSASLLHRI